MCLSKLLADLVLIFIFEGRQLVALTRIKKLTGHARLADRDAHPALKLAAGDARWNFGVSRDDNLLLPVILRLYDSGISNIPMPSVKRPIEEKISSKPFSARMNSSK